MSGLPDYDPDARRSTPLAAVLARRIARKGPISIRDYMATCLGHPEHGYYRTRTAIGRDGDFITAPEISQVFGELIGLWCAVVWQTMGSPGRFQLVEIGPGRGTMMRDAVRALRVVPGMLAAAQFRMVPFRPGIHTDAAGSEIVDHVRAVRADEPKRLATGSLATGAGASHPHGAVFMSRQGYG